MIIRNRTFVDHCMIGLRFFFHRSVIWRTRPDCLSELLSCDNCRRGPIVGLRHSDFYWTEVSAHGPIFYRRHIVGRKGPIFYRANSQCTRTDFHTDFCLR